MSSVTLTRRPSVAGLLLLVHLAGCTSWHSNPGGVQALTRDKHPKEIQVTLAGGQRMVLRSPQIEGDSLVGKVEHDGKLQREAVALEDIREAAVRQTSAGKTVLLIAGIGLTVVLIAAIAVASSDIGLGGGGGGGGGGEWGTSCPTVYSWDGHGWRLDSGTFGGAISRGLQRTDIDNLDFLRPFGGQLRLQVRAELQETDYPDQVRVLAADHAPGVMVVPDGRGGLHGVGALRPPVGVLDFRGRDQRARIGALDGWNWESSLTGWGGATGATRDGLELTFLREPGVTQGRLVVDGRNTPWSAYLLMRAVAAHGPELTAWYDSLDHDPAFARRTGMRFASEAFLRVSVRSDTGWEAQDLLWEAGPEVNKRQVALLDLRRVSGDSVRVRLEAPPAFWSLDRVALDLGPEPAFTVTRLAPARAIDRDGIDRSEALASADGHDLAMERGDAVDLSFTDAPSVDGLARSYLLESSGYYRLQVTPDAETGRGLLAAMGAEGGLSRAATAELARAALGLEREAR